MAAVNQTKGVSVVGSLKVLIIVGAPKQKSARIAHTSAMIGISSTCQSTSPSNPIPKKIKSYLLVDHTPTLLIIEYRAMATQSPVFASKIATAHVLPSASIADAPSAVINAQPSQLSTCGFALPFRISLI